MLNEQNNKHLQRSMFESALLTAQLLQIENSVFLQMPELEIGLKRFPDVWKAFERLKSARKAWYEFHQEVIDGNLQGRLSAEHSVRQVSLTIELDDAGFQLHKAVDRHKPRTPYQSSDSLRWKGWSRLTIELMRGILDAIRQLVTPDPASASWDLWTRNRTGSRARRTLSAAYGFVFPDRSNALHSLRKALTSPQAFAALEGQSLGVGLV